MELTEEEVKKIAELACIATSKDERTALKQDLINILNLVNEISAVDTKNVPPMAHPLNMPQRLRTDIVTEKDEHQLLQQNAKETESGLYLVPTVIE